MASTTTTVAHRKADFAGQVCRFRRAAGRFCQDLENTAPIWSDRQRCAGNVEHVEQQPPPGLAAVRHPAQATRAHASGGACGTGA
jgi:hypothetical protein